MLDEVARWDDLVTGLRPMTYGAKGEPARCLVSVGPTITAKASSEGWRLRLRPNTDTRPDRCEPRWPNNVEQITTTDTRLSRAGAPYNGTK
jgi:hypothetical protein